MSDFDPQTSELEVKYEIPEKLFKEYNLVSNGSPMQVVGTDFFYSLNDKAFRIRADKLVTNLPETAGVKPVINYCLTIKERTSRESLTVRREVDLTCHHDENPFEFFKMLGAKETFRIHKKYYIWKRTLLGTRPKLLLATYEVCDDKMNNKRHFLEVEVEKEGKWTLEERLKALSEFCDNIESELPVIGKPVNVSLYELYKPKG